jgi:hypothetical protein
MNLEKGSKSNPTGNLIVYCNVLGENPLSPGGKIIASNVVVSFLKLEDNFPVVTFPPISLGSYDELIQMLSEHMDNYDIAKLPDFELPQDKEKANSYIQSRMENFNSLVGKYVEFCKTREKSRSRQNVESELSGVEGYLRELTKLSMEFRNSKGLTKEVHRFQVDKLLDQFSSKHPQYDLDNFRKALAVPGQKGEDLASLYISKFNAINDEDYETASILKKKIVDLETKESYENE